MQEISFNKLRESLQHKSVKYIWYKLDGLVIKEFKADKFYINKSKYNMLSLPKFNLGTDAKYYLNEDGLFWHISEYGKTSFEVL